MKLTPIPPLSRFEESPFRRALVEWLRDVPVGEIATYADLTELIGEDIRTVRYLFQSARNELLKEGIAFDVVTNVGYKRLDDAGKVAAAEGHLTRSDRSALRSLRVLRTSDYAALSPAERVRHSNAELRSGAIRLFNSKSMKQKLDSSILAGTTSLKQLRASVQDTLKHFGG